MLTFDEVKRVLEQFKHTLRVELGKLERNEDTQSDPFHYNHKEQLEHLISFVDKQDMGTMLNTLQEIRKRGTYNGYCFSPNMCTSIATVLQRVGAEDE